MFHDVCQGLVVPNGCYDNDNSSGRLTLEDRGHPHPPISRYTTLKGVFSFPTFFFSPSESSMNQKVYFYLALKHR
jgi:hypothetical protein